MLKTILFDLDGTLLPMDQDEFTKAYFGSLAKKLAPYGYDPNKLIEGIWKGTAAMVKNDGANSNEKVFWKVFSEIFGEKVYADKEIFDDFYSTDFNNLQTVCGYNPQAKDIVKKLKELGYTLVLASNPIFPTVAQQSRMRWAGLDISDFELITSYENSGHCKPNPDYYREIVRKMGCKAEDCLMIGNDVTEDMVAQTVGMRTFLLTNCLINKENKDISLYPMGNFEHLLEFIKRQMN